MARRYVPEVPADLSTESQALWPGLVADLSATAGNELAEVEVLVLEEALRIRDRLAGVRAVLEEDGLIVRGSKRQKRPHPLLAVEAGLRRDLAARWRRLGFDPEAHGRPATAA